MKSLRAFLKDGVLQALAPFGAYPTSLTPRESLNSLIRQLRPYETAHRLVRLGPSSDGGYLVPDDLDGIAALFSPGVDVESGFEEDCANRGMEVFLADRSVDGPAVEHKRFNFVKKHLGSVDGPETLTFTSWIKDSGIGSDAELLLQMDIEGAEFQVLPTIDLDTLQRFRIIVVEFHNLQWLWSRPFFDVAVGSFLRILQGHLCVHIHPNNRNGQFRSQGLTLPQVAEFTFLRRDRAGESVRPATTFPHALDCPNGSGPDLALSDCWFK